MEKIYIWIIALMVLSALVTIIKPRIKGKMGEATVSMLLKKLDKNKYQVVNDVLLSLFLAQHPREKSQLRKPEYFHNHDFEARHLTPLHAHNSDIWDS